MLIHRARIGERTRIGEAIVHARKRAGLSQQELADLLGRDKRTLQKWEKGEIKIALEDFFEVFVVLQLPVSPYAKWIRHPELFPHGLEDMEHFSLDSKRAALADYYTTQASPLEIEQLYFILFGDHGSNYYGICQQCIANLQTPLRDRKRISGQVIDNYLEAQSAGTLTAPDGPQPNMALLQACYEASVESIRQGRNRYSIEDVDEYRNPRAECAGEE